LRLTATIGAFWTNWVLARPSPERKAPTRLGSRRHPIIEPAPGSYVRDLEPST